MSTMQCKSGVQLGCCYPPMTNRRLAACLGSAHARAIPPRIKIGLPLKHSLKLGGYFMQRHTSLQNGALPLYSAILLHAQKRVLMQ